MRKLLRPAVVGLALFGPGCSFVGDIRKNLAHEPVLACDEYQIKKRNRALGADAFAIMTGQYGCNFSSDYRDGFIDGFADYLTYGGCISGGCGEKPIVPPVPPSHYQRKQYMTPEGYQAMEDWFAGFRHGANTAQASGLRQLVVLPVFDPPKFGPDDAMKADYRPSTGVPGGQGGEPPGAGGSAAPGGATLPAPRALPEPTPAATPSAQPATTPPAATPTPAVPMSAGPAAGPPRAKPVSLNPPEHPF